MYEPELRIFGKTFLPRANFSKLKPSLFFRDHIFRKRDPRKQRVTLCRWVIPVACIFLAHHPRFLPPSLSIPSSPFFLSPHFRPSVTVRPQYQPPRPFNCRAVHFFRNLMQRIQFWFLFFSFFEFPTPCLYMQRKHFNETRPKPAYDRQGLDWMVWPGYSFGVSTSRFATLALSSVDDPDWPVGEGQGGN